MPQMKKDETYDRHTAIKELKGLGQLIRISPDEYARWHVPASNPTSLIDCFNLPGRIEID
jgi:hypothetical protein